MFKTLTPEFLAENHYFNPQLIDGQEVFMARLAFTVGIFVGADYAGYSYRYCFPDLLSANAAMDYMVKNNTVDVPYEYDWIVRKGLGGDIRNPERNQN